MRLLGGGRAVPVGAVALDVDTWLGPDADETTGAPSAGHG